MTSSFLLSEPLARQRLSSLPAEIRNHILHFLTEDGSSSNGFTNHGDPNGIIIDEDYNANRHLQALLTCKQFYHDGNLMALSRTSFVVANLFFNIPQRLSVLQARQIEAIRSMAFVADARHFRKLLEWGEHPFGMPSLRLDTLTIVLHRSSFWHYLFDFTADIVKLLRKLEGVKRFVFVRNCARVKGSFKTWYNRLVGLMMKIDHQERYLKTPSNPEKTWWSWSYDEIAHSFCLVAMPTKVMVDEETYMHQMTPLMEELRLSVETEEWNPDPRAWNGT